ncbi:MAG: META domain-containing protein [bacterium]
MKKRFVSTAVYGAVYGLATILIALTAYIPSARAAGTGSAVCNGDLNNDGDITPADALIAFKCYFASECAECADINQDGGITPADALCLFRKYLGLTSCLDLRSLFDKQWKLQSFGVTGEEKPLLAGSQITIQFSKDNTCEGTAGCNHYFGTHTPSDEGALSIRGIGCTKMYCLSPQGVMEQEMQYLAALSTVCSFEINQNNLRLLYDNKHKVLNFITSQGSYINIDEFIQLANNSPCADRENKLYVIDGAMVFHSREGNCADWSYSRTLFGKTPDEIVCSLSDSIAGPQKHYYDPNHADIFDTIIDNLSHPTLGLDESHTVEDIPFRDASGSLPVITDPVIPPPPPDRPQAVPGEIIVVFIEDATEEDADNLVKSHSLSWRSNFPAMFSYWVKVLNGSPADCIDELEKEDIVAWAERRGNPSGEEGASYILIQFNTGATVKAAQELIGSFENLEISSLNMPQKWGVVTVPAGTEQHWIETFKKSGMVKNAEMNLIRYP